MDTVNLENAFTNKISAKPKRKIAIIGSGVAGLSCAWHLQNHCDVEIFESEDKIGGHCHTIKYQDEYGTQNIDMGFIVFNEACYPNLVKLFENIGQNHELTDMSFGVSAKNGGFEYSSLGIKGVFAQWQNLLNPKFYAMIFDIFRFNKLAKRDFAIGKNINLNLGQYLEKYGFSQIFIENHLLPQAAAIWSASSEKIMEFPFEAFVRFFENHGLLQIQNRILWRSVDGGALSYVDKLMKDFRGKINCSKPIFEIEKIGGKYIIHGKSKNLGIFDEIVFATPADVTSKLVSTFASNEIKEVFSNFTYTKNQVYLHQDENLMPKRKAAWAAWNYISKGEKEAELCVSYYMNLLQRLKSKKDYFVTLNPPVKIEEGKIIAHRTFCHPFFDAKAISAQKQVSQFQGHDGIWFCGSYLGYGFHEDALQSGLFVAEAISQKRRPWDFDFTQSRIAFDENLAQKITAFGQ